MAISTHNNLIVFQHGTSTFVIDAGSDGSGVQSANVDVVELVGVTGVASVTADGDVFALTTA